jgi:hypothetical protein
LGDDNPNSAQRPSWGKVNFLFNRTGLQPGRSSKLFFFNTTATDYGKIAKYDLTGTGAADVSSAFAAYTPVFNAVTFNNGILHIPVVDATAAGFGVYKVDMQLISLPPLKFEVTGLTELP